MQAKAILKYARISPRKVKIVLDLLRGKDADVAMAILQNTPSGKRRQQSPYGRLETLRFRVLRVPRTYAQAHDAQSKGKRRQNTEENISRDYRSL